MNSYQFVHNGRAGEGSQGEKSGVIAGLKLINKIRNVFSSNVPCLKIANRESSVGNAFTLIELLVVIAIISILAAMLLPALKAAKDKTKGILCMNQMKQLVFANQIYISEFNDYPATARPNGHGLWYELLTPYLGNKLTVWGCPVSEHANLMNTSYPYINPTQTNVLFKQAASIGCNGWTFGGRDGTNKLRIYKTTLFKEPSKLVYCADGRTGKELQAAGGDINLNTMIELRANNPIAPYENNPGTYSYYVRHNKIINIGFLDGHAEGINYNEFQSWCRIPANEEIRIIGF